MASSLNTKTNWSFLKKLGFRFSFIFFLLYILIQNNGAFPLWEYVLSFLTNLLHLFIPWVAENLLHLPDKITVFTNGSGDTTYDYVLLLTFFITAVVGSIIWTLLDRKRPHYQVLYYWLTVAMRYYVGLMLFAYGMLKVIKLQFPSPGLARLTQAYGDSSPMGLAWTFLGFSDGYNLFMGLAEVAALMLLFRRTTTLGAIITLMTTANVMAVNYFYDVPVKILSTALFTMTLFILIYDAERLIKFFFKGAQVSLPMIKAPVITSKSTQLTKTLFKSILIGGIIIFGIEGTMRAKKQYGSDAPKPPLYGLYYVNTFIVNGDTIPPLLTDTTRWKNFIVAYEGYGTVRKMEDEILRFKTELDTSAQSIKIVNRNDPEHTGLFTFVQEAESLTFSGMLLGDSVFIKMNSRNLDESVLMGRGFHWINEYPFNR